jgi:hypothetical protein
VNYPFDPDLIDPAALSGHDPAALRPVLAGLALAGILTTVQSIAWTASEAGPAAGYVVPKIEAAAHAAVLAADALLPRLGRATETPTPTGKDGR